MTLTDVLPEAMEPDSDGHFRALAVKVALGRADDRDREIMTAPEVIGRYRSALVRERKLMEGEVAEIGSFLRLLKTDCHIKKDPRRWHAESNKAIDRRAALVSTISAIDGELSRIKESFNKHGHVLGKGKPALTATDAERKQRGQDINDALSRIEEKVDNLIAMIARTRD